MHIHKRSIIPLGGLLLQEAGNEVFHAHVRIRPVQSERQFRKQNQRIEKIRKSSSHFPAILGLQTFFLIFSVRPSVTQRACQA